MATPFIVAASGFAISAGGFYFSRQQANNIDSQAKEFLATKVLSVNDIKDGQRHIAQIIVPKVPLYGNYPCSILQLYKQKQVSTTETQPFTQVNMNAIWDEKIPPITHGVQQVMTKGLRFVEHRNLFTDPTFGHTNVTPSSSFHFLSNPTLMRLMEANRSDGDPRDGKTTQDTLKHKFGISYTLDHTHMYKIKDVSLQGHTLYLLGQRYGSKFTYDHVAMDPKSLIGFEYENSGWKVLQSFSFGGMIASILFGACTIDTDPPRSRL